MLPQLPELDMTSQEESDVTKARLLSKRRLSQAASDDSVTRRGGMFSKLRNTSSSDHVPANENEHDGTKGVKLPKIIEARRHSVTKVSFLLLCFIFCIFSTSFFDTTFKFTNN